MNLFSPFKKPPVEADTRGVRPVDGHLALVRPVASGA